MTRLERILKTPNHYAHQKFKHCPGLLDTLLLLEKGQVDQAYQLYLTQVRKAIDKETWTRSAIELYALLTEPTGWSIPSKQWRPNPVGVHFVLRLGHLADEGKKILQKIIRI